MELPHQPAWTPRPGACMTPYSPPGGRLAPLVRVLPPPAGTLAQETRIPATPLPRIPHSHPAPPHPLPPLPPQSGAKQMHPEHSLSGFKLDNTSSKQISGYPGAWVVLHLEATVLGRPLDSMGPEGQVRMMFIHSYTPGV